MKIHSFENPILGTIEHFDEHGRKVATTYPDPITGVSITYDNHGKKIGSSFENPVTMITTYYDRKGRKSSQSYHNDIIGATEHFDNHGRRTGIYWDNPVTGIVDHDGPNPYGSGRMGTTGSSSSARKPLLEIVEIKNPEPVKVRVTMKDFDTEENRAKFAEVVARSLVQHGTPYDGSLNGPAEERKDGYYLLQDNTRYVLPERRKDVPKTEHQVYILRGDGKVLRATYQESYLEKEKPVWFVMHINRSVTDMIDEYLKNHRITANYASFLEFLKNRNK